MRIGILLLAFFILAPFAARPGEQENLTRVMQSLQARSIPFELRSLPGATSLLARAQQPSQGTFVLALPLQADFAVETGLALAGQIQNRNMPVNIIVAFLGNEIPQEPEGVFHQGLDDLLTLVDVPENWVLAYFDVAQTPEAVILHHGARGYVAPFAVLQPFAELLSQHEIPWSLRVRFNEIYKLGLVEGHRALSLTLEDEINAFALTGSPALSAGISAEDAAALFLEYALELEFPLLKVDRHYFLFTVPGGQTIFFSQGFTVTLLLIAAGVCLFLFLIYSARYHLVLLFQTRLFFRSIWIFFLLLVLLVVSLMVSGLFHSLLFRTFGPSDPALLPEHIYFPAAGLTLMLAVLVFFLHSPLFSMIRIPKRAQFYGFSSVIFVIMGLLTAAFLDFSFVPAFLWASLFVFLAASLSKPVLVFLSVLLIPLFAHAALLNIFETGSVILAQTFIFPDWQSGDSWLAAVLAALFCLPLILLIKRGVLLVQKSRQRKTNPHRTRRRLITVTALLAVVLTAMAVQIALISHSVI